MLLRWCARVCVFLRVRIMFKNYQACVNLEYDCRYLNSPLPFAVW